MISRRYERIGISLALRMFKKSVVSAYTMLEQSPWPDCRAYVRKAIQRTIGGTVAPTIAPLS